MLQKMIIEIIIVCGLVVTLITDFHCWLNIFLLYFSLSSQLGGGYFSSMVDFAVALQIVSPAGFEFTLFALESFSPVKPQLDFRGVEEPAVLA